MNFEGTAFGGKKAIQEKLMSLGSTTSQAASIAHSIKQMDFSLGLIQKQTALALVSGVLTIDGEIPSVCSSSSDCSSEDHGLSNDMFRFISLSVIREIYHVFFFFITMFRYASTKPLATIKYTTITYSTTNPSYQSCRSLNHPYQSQYHPKFRCIQ